MYVHVTVELDGESLVVVKSAPGGEAAARLRTEAERLDRARHPGVVTLIDAGPIPSTEGAADDPAADERHGGGYALRLAHAGEPVTHWRAPVPHVAGVAAAVASTLADLHDLGVVHGRLDATHVLVGHDGRPQMCGLRDPGDATPEDDVAAWGRLVAELLSRAPDRSAATPVWRAGLGGGRKARAARRALGRIADRATDPLAGRRPTARAAADAVVAAVPDATLPTALPDTRPDSDTLDRIWSYAGEPSEAERWAAAFGASPDAAADVPARPPDAGTAVPTGDATRPPADLPLALASSPAWDATPTEDGHDGDADRPAWNYGPGWGEGSVWHDTAAEGRDLGWEGDPADLDDSADEGRPAAFHARRGPGYDPWFDRDRDIGRTEPEPARGSTSGVERQRSVDGADTDAPGHRVGGIAERRARPAASDRHHPHAARRRPLRTAALVAATVGGVALVGSAMVVARTTRATGPASPPAAAGETCPPVESPAADVDGDGCREALVLDGSTVDAGAMRWTLGEPGDVVAIGDWDCDGQATAALLRPSTGDVFHFPAWAATGEQLTVAPVDQVPGATSLRRAVTGDPACDRLVAEAPDGTATDVEVTR